MQKSSGDVLVAVKKYQKTSIDGDEDVAATIKTAFTS